MPGQYLKLGYDRVPPRALPVHYSLPIVILNVSVLLTASLNIPLSHHIKQIDVNRQPQTKTFIGVKFNTAYYMFRPT